MFELNEPTGHLDVNNIAMIKDWLCAFPGTIIATSHDSGFLNDMTTHIIDFEDRMMTMRASETTMACHRLTSRRA